MSGNDRKSRNSSTVMVVEDEKVEQDKRALLVKVDCAVDVNVDVNVEDVKEKHFLDDVEQKGKIVEAVSSEDQLTSKNSDAYNDNSSDLVLKRKMKSSYQRWATRILYGALASGRAIFAILASRYTEAYRLGEINIYAFSLLFIMINVFIWFLTY